LRAEAARQRRRLALGVLHVSRHLPVGELAVHALAQAPPAVRLELEHSALDAELVQLAEAYGVSSRLTFASAPGDATPRFSTPHAAIDVDSTQAPTIGALVESLSAGCESTLEMAEGPDDAILSRQRVVIVTNYPAHYRLPLFQGMARRLAAVGAELHVMFLSRAEDARPWLAKRSELDFDHEFLASVRVPVRRRAPLVPAALGRRLRSFRPSIVVAGGFSPFVAYRAAQYATSVGAVFGIWSGETSAMPTAHQRGRHLTRLHIVRCADFAIAYGSRATAYLRVLRPDLPIVVGRNTAPVPQHLPTPGGRTPDGMFEFVVIGDLASPRKGVDVVIDALHLARDLPLTLLVIGGGKLLRTLAKQTSQDERIKFLGPLSPPEVSCRLAHANALVFPTRADVFGLALVEGMGHALTAIVSPAAGAVDDLAVDGHNAIIVQGHQPSEWATALALIVDDPTRATEIGASARRTIEARWTVRHAVEAMIAGLRLGAAVGERRTAA
jgi:glycosyltransferase involved in cell wall biosynthesis